MGQDNLTFFFQMEAGQIDVGGIVGIATGTTYTPPAPTTQSEIDLSRDLSRKMKVMGTNLESHEKNKPPSNVVHTSLVSS